MPNPWPLDSLEHELRSLRRYLMAFDQAPARMRIHHTEGAFKRPEIAITVHTASRSTLGSRLQTLSRAGNVSWYGGEREEDAWSAASWLTTALTDQEGALGRGAIRIWDFSANPPTLVERTAMEVEQDSVSATVLPNPVNNWAVQIDLRWQVRLGLDPARMDLPPTAIPQGPIVTQMPFKIVIGG